MTEFIDIDVTEYVGMDIEREDRDVGMFGNVYILCFKDKEGKQYQMAIGDDDFTKLYGEVKKEGESQGFEYETEMPDNARNPPLSSKKRQKNHKTFLNGR